MVDVVGSSEISTDLQTLAKNVNQNANLALTGNTLIAQTPTVTNVSSSRQKPSSCDLCGKVFSRYDNLERHRRIHQGEKLYHCDICSKSFAQSSYLKVHRRTHSGERPFKCNICGYAFSRSDHLVRHIRTHHANQQFVTNSKSCLNTHANQQLSGQSASNGQCMDSCNNNHNNHFQSNAVACRCPVNDCSSCKEACPEDSYNCSMGCEMGQFSSQEHQHVTSNSKAHRSIQSCQGSAQRAGSNPFNCDICWKAFSQTSHVNIHKRIHAAVLPYRCHLCGKSFSRQDNLKRHIITHKGLKLYSCKVCNKAFSRRSYLKVHHRIHSGERPYRCTICDYAFSRNDHLIRHNRPNKGERKFSCVPLHNKDGYQGSSVGCGSQELLQHHLNDSTDQIHNNDENVNRIANEEAADNNSNNNNATDISCSESFDPNITTTTPTTTTTTTANNISQHLTPCLQQPGPALTSETADTEELAASGHQQLHHITSVPITQIFPTIQMSPSTSQIFPAIQMAATHMYPINTQIGPTQPVATKNIAEANKTL
ncbi:finger 808-like [Octopus vulgaris]|uniref:Finger 808-like n=1 Tax=Octopus vulgaris TaxID=6645 RepID=A0AA36FC92_OCTVU|nr:finger 808-like [Octopus vulgaris]